MERWQETTYQWRVSRRLSQWRAAAIAGVSLTSWSRWERGETEPHPEMARRVLQDLRTWDEERAAWAKERHEESLPPEQRHWSE
jgi:transcriptional regulator with XRE-family HTH domain